MVKIKIKLTIGEPNNVTVKVTVKFIIAVTVAVHAHWTVTVN